MNLPHHASSTLELSDVPLEAPTHSALFSTSRVPSPEGHSLPLLPFIPPEQKLMHQTQSESSKHTSPPDMLSSKYFNQS